MLKPAEQSSLSAIRLAELGQQAGLPRGVFNVVTGYGEETGKPLALHMDVDMIAFTGSTEVGKLIMGYAAQSNVKRVALELGGKSPLVVFADADLDAAASAVAWGCFYNSGETCHASTRLIVERSVQDALIEKIEAVTKSDITLAHPFEPSAQIGALIEEEHMDKVLGMVAAGEKEGARRAFGAERVLTETGGYYVSPGVFVDMTNDMSPGPPGNLRSRACRHPVRQRGGSAQDRQRHDLRAWLAPSSRRTWAAPTASPKAYMPARCGSTPTTCRISPRPSAASSSPASAATGRCMRSTNIATTRPSGSISVEAGRVRAISTRTRTYPRKQKARRAT